MITRLQISRSLKTIPTIKQTTYMIKITSPLNVVLCALVSTLILACANENQSSGNKNTLPVGGVSSNENIAPAVVAETEETYKAMEKSNKPHAVAGPPTSNTPITIRVKYHSELDVADYTINLQSLLKYAVWTPKIESNALPAYLIQRYCLSNKPVIAEDFAYAGTSEIVHVCFAVNEPLSDEIRASIDSAPPVKQGTYALTPASKQIGTISEAKLRIRTEGTRSGANYLFDTDASGSVTIEYSDKQRIKGTLRFTQLDRLVEGNFDTELKQKSADIEYKQYPATAYH
jgi:hypothetical protein